MDPGGNELSLTRLLSGKGAASSPLPYLMGKPLLLNEAALS
jgi:hypothetical protein